MCWSVSGDTVMSENSLAALLVDRASGASGGHVAVYQSRLGVWVPFSWKELCAMAERIGNGLLAKGVKSGDVVAIISDNSVEFIASEYAIVGIGATAMLISTDYSPLTASALMHAHDVRVAIVGDQEQFDKCVDGSEPIANVVVVETRGLRELEVAGRADRATRSTLTQLIDDAGAASSWRAGVAGQRETSAALLVTSIDGSDVVVSSVTHGDLLTASRASVGALSIVSSSRLLAQHPLSESAEQVISVGTSLVSGCALSIGEGGPLASSELVQVAPTHLHAAPSWLSAIHADASRRVGATGGLKRLALGGQLPTAVSGGQNSTPAILSTSRIIGLATTVAVLAFLLVSTSMNDWIRIVISAVIAAVGGLVFLRTPAAVRGSIRRRYGLNACRVVVGDAANLVPGSEGFLAAIGVDLVPPTVPAGDPVGRVPSSVLAQRLGASR